MMWLAVVGVLPTATPALTTRICVWRLRLKAELSTQRHDPLMLEQLYGTSTLVRIAVEAFHQEVNALLAKLVTGGKLGRISLGDVVHNGPLVVHRCPWAAACCHLENDATKRPDIHSAMAASTASLDNLGGHVHRCTGH